MPYHTPNPNPNPKAQHKLELTHDPHAVLLSALWYCHKRGREVRLEREASEREAAAASAAVDEAAGGSRVEELPDDPQLPAARNANGKDNENDNEHVRVFPPPSSETAAAMAGK